jgi:hypothetical protein
VSLFEIQRYGEAFQSFEAAIKAKPEFREARYNKLITERLCDAIRKKAPLSMKRTDWNANRNNSKSRPESASASSGSSSVASAASNPSPMNAPPTPQSSPPNDGNITPASESTPYHSKENVAELVERVEKEIPPTCEKEGATAARNVADAVSMQPLAQSLGLSTHYEYAVLSAYTYKSVWMNCRLLFSSI